MPTIPAQPRSLPATVWWLAALYCVASLVHFAHNAEHVHAYPNLPAWLTREGVYASWLVVTAVGLAGVVLARRGRLVAGAMVLAVYGSFGLYGLAHYSRAPLAQHTMAMNATIWFEAATGALLALAALSIALSIRRQR